MVFQISYSNHLHPLLHRRYADYLISALRKAFSFFCGVKRTLRQFFVAGIWSWLKTCDLGEGAYKSTQIAFASEGPTPEVNLSWLIKAIFSNSQWFRSQSSPEMLKMCNLGEEKTDCCLKRTWRAGCDHRKVMIKESGWPINKGLERTENQRSARGEEMWGARIIEQSEPVSGSSSSLKR